MERALLALICAVLLAVVILLLGDSLIRATDILEQSWVKAEDRRFQMAKEEVTNLAETSCDGAHIYLNLRNDGELSLTSFDKWDVIVQYYSSGGNCNVKWLAYDTASPISQNRWEVEGIYLDASGSVAEVYGPEVLDPGEEIKMHLRVSPDVSSGTTGRVTISNPEGIESEILFSR